MRRLTYVKNGHEKSLSGNMGDILTEKTDKSVISQAGCVGIECPVD